MLTDLKAYLIERFKERSTYVGLSAFCASIQYQYTEALVDDAMAFFIILCGLGVIFTKD